MIPAYNVEKYIRKCLDSISSQTYKNYEVVIVNDGSTDNTLEICKQYKNNDSRIRIVTQNNEGVSAARNRCLHYARGQFVAFIDPDDFVSDDYLQHLIGLQQETSADIVACNYIILDNGKKKLEERNRFSNRILNNKQALRAINCFDSFKVYMWGKLIRKDLFNNLSFPNVEIAEDQYVCCELLDRANTIYYSPSPLYTYRIHAGSICQEVDKHDKTPILAVHEQVRYISEHHPDLTPFAYSYYYFCILNYYNQHVVYTFAIPIEECKYINSETKGKLKYVLHDPDITISKKTQAVVFQFTRPIYNIIIKYMN